MSIIREIAIILLANRRHKAYENRLTVVRTRGAAITGTIKSKNS